MKTNKPITMSAELSRRQFLSGTLLAASATAATWPALGADVVTGSSIVVFSKVYQELELNFEDAAAVTAEAGLNGIDCPVRPGGEIIPEQATDELPRYVEVLGRRGLKLPLLATAITGVDSPLAETLLRTARKLGVQYYRLGFIDRQRDVAAETQVREVRARLKDLAALNKQLGLGALLQNHSPAGRTTYFGGDLNELAATVEGFDPAQIGVAFDIAHALVVHGDDWRQHFERLKPHFKIAYVKDVKRPGRWVPFGEGEIAGTGYFQLLKQMHYQAPISLHIEFDWSDQGKAKTRAALVSALRQSGRMLRQWLAG